MLAIDAWSATPAAAAYAAHEPLEGSAEHRKSRGTPGSTRPDNYSETLRLPVDVKNYGIETIKGQTRLVKNVVRQMTQRETHLPKGSRQGVVIDARGQAVPPSQIAALRARIVRASGGLVAPDDIVFLTE